MLEIAAESPTMTASWIDMQFTIVSSLVHTGIISHAIGNRRNHIVVIRHQKNRTRRQMTTNSLVIRPFFYQLRIRLALITQEIDAGAFMSIALIHRDNRIEEYRKIRTISIFSMRTDRRSKMTTSRESHDTYILRIYMPYRCTISYRTDSLISIP